MHRTLCLCRNHNLLLSTTAEPHIHTVRLVDEACGSSPHVLEEVPALSILLHNTSLTHIWCDTPTCRCLLAKDSLAYFTLPKDH